MSETLRIAMVCYPSAGGSGIVAAELAAGMARRGHDVHVISTQPPHRGVPPGDNVHFHAVTVPDYPLFDSPPYTVAVAATIVRVVQEHAIDIVHTHYAVPHAASAQLAAQALGASRPCIVGTLHGTDVTRVGADPNLASIARATTCAADGLSVPSEFLKLQALHWLAAVRPPEIDVIPNFVDVARFAPPARRSREHFAPLFPATGRADDSPVLVHVSNFRPIKRVADAVEALARVRARMPARLCLIGDGPERAPVERRARELGVHQAVCFLGRQVDVAPHIAHADAFLLTSESESFGLAALEALSCGVPVFGYRVGGLPEVLGASGGRLVTPLDAGALAEALLEVLQDEAAHEQLRASARRHVLAHFRDEPALDRYERWYLRTLAAARHRSKP